MSGPVAATVQALLEEAVRRGSSDVHIQPERAHGPVRLRIDGHLHDQALDAPGRLPALIPYFKVQAGLRGDAVARPQDGRWSWVSKGGARWDLRLSVIPGLRDESLVVRLLPHETPLQSLDALGLPAPLRAQLMHALEAREGLYLVAGPTGSGKTTTLYALLRALDPAAHKIVTVEDPVEYRLPGVSQVAARAGGPLDFAGAVRAFLRQSPDVILIGEIRDAETARAALRAALSGHLVWASIHTGDAPEVLPRLDELGLEPALVNVALRGVLAQRLLRRLCGACARPAKQPPRLPGCAEPAVNAREAVGCSACQGRGYAGRTGVFSWLPIDAAFLRAARAEVARGARWADLARGQGWQPLREAGWGHVCDGTTSLHELLAQTLG